MTKARTGKDGWREGKGQVGIDGNKDADFGKMRRANDPWSVRPNSEADCAYGDGVRRVDNVKPGAGIDDDIGVGILRDTGMNPENYAKIDILEMVEGQADKTGPVVLRKRDR